MFLNDQIIKELLTQVRLDSFIDNLEFGINTRVGERGVQLSGGQRQRIGIARALYKDADVIIFDEATSSLDNLTESLVMQAIDALSDNITLLIVAHRLSTLKKCSQIIELDENGIKQTGSYNEVINESKDLSSNVK